MSKATAARVARSSSFLIQSVDNHSGTLLCMVIRSIRLGEHHAIHIQKKIKAI